MTHYNDAEHPQCNLDRFVGKEVWVKCVFTGWGNTQYYYVRVLDKTAQGYVVNWVPEFTVNDFEGCNDDVLFRTLGTSRYTRMGDIAYVTPAEVLTTGELLGNNHDFDTNLYVDAADKLSQYIGTDIWVRVSSPNFYDGYGYINILSREGNIFKYRAVGAGFIDEGDSFYLMDDNEIISTLNMTHTAHIGDFTVTEPEITYTTEEIGDIIGVSL